MLPSDHLVRYCELKHAAQSAWAAHERAVDALYPGGIDSATRRQRDYIDTTLALAVEAQREADDALEAYWRAYTQYEREQGCAHANRVVVEYGGMSYAAGNVYDSGRTEVVCRDCGKEFSDGE